MAVSKKECIRIEVEEGTLGGRTFYVRHPDWDNEEKAICFRPVKNIPGYDRANMFCSRMAGHGTDHVGQGACRTHGGMNHAKVPFGTTNGRRSNMTQKHMKHRIDEFIQNDRAGLMDLTYELGAMRVLFRDLIELFPNSPEDKEYGMYVTRAINMIGTVGSLVDKISRIETRNTITANQVIYLRATVADLLIKYIEDPKRREQAVQDLLSRMPGGTENALMEGEYVPAIIDGEIAYD